jgi:hypothetical protein
VAPEPFVRRLGARGALFEATHATAPDVLATMLGGAGLAEVLGGEGVAPIARALAREEDAEALLRQAGDAALVVAIAPRPQGAPAWTATPMALVAPGLAPVLVRAAVRSDDVAPTLLDLLHLEGPSTLRGASLLPLARGAPEPPRPVLVEDGGRRVLVHDGRVLVSGARNEAFALATGAPLGAEAASELHARLDAALRGVPVVGEPERRSTARVALRFAGAGRAHRVVGTLEVDGGEVRAHGGGLHEGAVRVSAHRVELAFATEPDAVVGVDLEIEPADAALRWELWLDDAPWPERSVFVGPHGLVDPRAASGLQTAQARRAADAAVLPSIDAARDLGVFVVRRYSMPYSDSLL